MIQQPPVLPYGDPHSAPRGPSPGSQVTWGVLIGTALSAAVWILGWPAVLGASSFPWAIVVVPGAKMLAAIVLLIPRNYRFVGIGLLISIPIGVAIFFGSCFMHK